MLREGVLALMSEMTGAKTPPAWVRLPTSLSLPNLYIRSAGLCLVALVLKSLGVNSWGYGAMAACLTPDQKVGILMFKGNR